MLIFERVVAEDKQHSPTEPPSGTFSPALQDAYDLFSDLCLLTRSQGAGTLGLGNLFGAIGANQNEGGKVRLLKNLSGVGKAFGLELIESLLGGFEGCLKAVSLWTIDTLTAETIPTASSASRLAQKWPVSSPRPQPNGKILILSPDPAHNPAHFPSSPIIPRSSAR